MSLASGVPVLETERLRLRGFRPSDLDDYAALNADIRVQRTISDGVVWDRSRSWRHLAFVMGHWISPASEAGLLKPRRESSSGRLGFGAQRGGPILSWRGLSPTSGGDMATPRKEPEPRCASDLRWHEGIGLSA